MLVLYADGLYDLLYKGRAIINQQGGKDFDCAVRGVDTAPIMFEKSDVIALLQGKDVRIDVNGLSHAITVINCGD